MHVIPLLPGCPWESWSRPNVKWCENNLCSIITTPANTWSNLFYCFFSILMWKEARPTRPALRLFAVASMLVGVTSFAYHASYTWFFQLFDFIGMFCFCMISVTLNCRRLNQLSQHKLVVFFTSGVTVCTLSFLCISMLGLPVQLIIVGLIMLILCQEWWLQRNVYRRHPRLRPKMKKFVQAMVLLAVAFAFSLADMLRVWCNPNNHVINGHSIWHILTSVTLYLLFQYHKQFAYDQYSANLLPIKISTV